MSAVMSRPAADFYTSTDERSVDELDAAIGRLVLQMNADSYRMLVLVREFDDRFGWKKWSYKSCAEWLAWRASITLSTAREKVRTAHALRGLPAITAAFEAGRLSYSKVRALTRVAHLHDEDLLLKYALDAAVPHVEERCRQIRNVSPDSVQHARRAWERRSLTLWRDEGRGTLRLTVEVPIEEGELIVRALDCAVAGGEVTTDVSPDAIAEAKGTAWRAQQADALVAVAKSYLDGGHGGEGGNTADHYQVVVHADAKSLTGGVGRLDLPIDSVKRLLCDCSVVVVAEDADGNPLDVGRKHRTVSTPLKRALYARDRGCTFPGCHRKRYLDGHHLDHWLNGGETNPDNMALLCTYHHRLLHEGAFSIVKQADDSLRFITADGRTIPRGGYRLEDFVDDDVGGEPDEALDDASREGFCTAPVQREWERAEVREPAAVYYLRRS
ncbi:MAG: HNH endonuclease [Lysobacterales bacterium]|nr:MAG: HNH endonuclease [Xanthomonadales bacterium]